MEKFLMKSISEFGMGKQTRFFGTVVCNRTEKEYVLEIFVEPYGDDPLVGPTYCNFYLGKVGIDLRIRIGHEFILDFEADTLAKFQKTLTILAKECLLTGIPRFESLLAHDIRERNSWN